LPLLESLSLRTPSIVGNHIHSIENLTEDGMIKLSEINHETLYSAIIEILDDQFAQRKYDEIKCLKLIKWKDFGLKVQTWLTTIK